MAACGAARINMVGMMSDRMMRSVAGFKEPSQWQRWNPASVELFTYLPGDYQNEDLTGVVITGTLTLEIRKLAVVKTMPFAWGGWSACPGGIIFCAMPRSSRTAADCTIVTDSVNSGTARRQLTASGRFGISTWLVQQLPQK